MHAADWVAGAETARTKTRTFKEMAVLAEALREALAPGVTVLLKASRGAALERALADVPLES